MKKLKVVIVGCGDRASVYANEGVNNLNAMEVVAVVDPDMERLRYAQENFGVRAENCCTDIQEVLKQGKIADCVIN